ncbi:DUF4116 domain-containing protein, partial [Roseibium sp. RKSG952]|uniref:DUF4116 domain-containing protein n=1 Tax=Roseibium sp. RKSG952 TaxID=2529384 RepID=UPI0012BBDDF2
GKFQLWVTGNKIQFVDADDAKIAAYTIACNADRFLPLVEWVMTQNGWALKHVPESLRTEGICLAAVRQNGWTLQLVSEALR